MPATSDAGAPEPSFATLDVELMATVLGLWLGGVALFMALETAATTPAERNGGSIVGTAMLMALLLAFAPVAFLGGSSTSLMLCLAAVAGLAAAALWELVVPRGAFSASAVFGVGCGLLAMIDTVTLITRHVDLAALALLLLIPYAGEVGARLPAAAEAIPWARPPGSCRDLCGFAYPAGDGSLISSPSRAFVMRSEPCAELLRPSL